MKEIELNSMAADYGQPTHDTTSSWEVGKGESPGEGPSGAKKVRVLRIARSVVLFAQRVFRGIRLLLLVENDRQLIFDIS